MKTYFIALIFPIIMLINTNANAGNDYAYQCYETAQYHLGAFINSNYKTACKNIENRWASACVTSVFNNVRATSYINMINACASVENSTHYRCVNNEIHASAGLMIVNLTKKIKECTEW